MSSLRTRLCSCDGDRVLRLRAARARRRRRHGRSRPRRTRARATRRSSGSRRSSRAASSAWIAGGTAISPASSSPSASMASICSRKSGFPSAASAMRRLACGESSVPAASAPMSTDDSSWESGSSRMEVAFSFPPAQPGRPSSSSGRARQRISTGALRTQSARCSIRSSSVGSAQWTSSKTSTSGRSLRERLGQLADRPEDLLADCPARARSDGAVEPLGDRVRVRVVAEQLPHARGRRLPGPRSPSQASR